FRRNRHATSSHDARARKYRRDRGSHGIPRARDRVTLTTLPREEGPSRPPRRPGSAAPTPFPPGTLLAPSRERRTRRSPGHGRADATDQGQPEIDEDGRPRRR